VTKKTNILRSAAFAIAATGLLFAPTAWADDAFDAAFDAYYKVSPSYARLEAELPSLLDDAIAVMGFKQGTPQFEMVKKAGAAAQDATRAHFRDQVYDSFSGYFSAEQMRQLAQVFSDKDVNEAVKLGAKVRTDAAPYTKEVFRDELQKAVLNLINGQ